MTPKEMLRSLYKKVAIKENLEKPTHKPQIGGIWHADVYRHPNGQVVAQLCDDGYTIAIITTDLHVYQTCDFDVKYIRGSEKQLVDLFNEMQ